MTETPSRLEIMQREGPFVSAALVCEKVLEEGDGVKSAIRMIDRVVHSPVVAEAREEMKPFNYALTLLIKLKSGWTRGSYPLEIRLAKPSGETHRPVQQMLNLEGEEDRGVDVVGNIVIRFDMVGIYWFKVYFDDVLLTQIPFRVIYTPRVRQIGGSGEPRPPAQESPPGS